MFHVKRATGAHRTCKDVGHRKGAGLQPPAGGTINHNPTSRARARSIASCTTHDVDAVQLRWTCVSRNAAVTSLTNG